MNIYFLLNMSYRYYRVNINYWSPTNKKIFGHFCTKMSEYSRTSILLSNIAENILENSQVPKSLKYFKYTLLNFWNLNLNVIFSYQETNFKFPKLSADTHIQEFAVWKNGKLEYWEYYYNNKLVELKKYYYTKSNLIRINWKQSYSKNNHTNINTIITYNN